MIPATKVPAVAMLGEYLGRYPWLTLAVAAGPVALAAIAHALPGPWLAQPGTILMMAATALSIFLGIAAIFGANEPQPKTGRNGYPPRMFRLPISTSRLVAWPMLCGTAAMALAWAAIALAVLPRFGFRPSPALGALGLAAALAWLQALGWWPFGSNLTQLIATGVTLPALIAAVAWPIVVWGWGPAVAWVLLPAYIAAAYALSVRGVTLDRRGDGRGGRGWTSVRERVDGVVEALPGFRPRFTTAAGAQLWFEWRSKGAALLFLVVYLSALAGLPFAAASAFLVREPRTARGFLAILMVQPLVFAWLLGGSFARDDLWSKSYAVSPFLATRPMTTGSIVGIKLVASAMSLAVAFGFALLTMPAWVAATGNVGAVAGLVRTAARERGGLAVGLVAATGLFAVLLIVWKSMVGSMLPILTGRPWFVNVVAYAVSALGAAFGLASVWIGLDPGRVARAAAALPWGLGVGLGLKLAVSAVAFVVAIRRGLIAPGRCAGVVACWAGAAACFAAVGVATLRPLGVAWPSIAMASALIPPLGRIAAATLAYDWNRHR